jgi:hypothetical protein
MSTTLSPVNAAQLVQKSSDGTREPGGVSGDAPLTNSISDFLLTVCDEKNDVSKNDMAMYYLSVT